MQPVPLTRQTVESRLCRALENAFERRESVQLGSHEYTYRKKGEILESELNSYEALANGIYQKAPIHRDLNQPPINHTYMFMSQLDELESLVQLTCSEMTLNELEELTVGLNARKVLLDMNPKRGKLATENQEPGL